MIKRLLKSVREYKKPALLAPLFVAAEVGMEVIIPILMARMIDKGIEAGDMHYILKMGVLLVIACGISLVFGMCTSKYATFASSGFASNLRHDMYYHLQEYSFSNIDKFSTSSLITRFTTDVENVQMSFQMSTRMAVRAPVMILFSLIAAFSVNAKMALIFLGIIPILGIGLYLIMSKAYPIFERVFKRYDDLNSVVGENLHGIRVVKSFIREEKEKEKFNAVSQNIYNDYIKAEKILAFNSPLMQFCMYTCTLLLSWFGAQLIVGSGNNSALGMTTGQLTSMLTYATRILMSLMMLSMVFVMITMSKASAERIAEVLEEESDIQNPENPVYTVKDGSVAFRDVIFSYAKDPNKLCLQDVTIQIPSGATVGIIGGTGSSKSTLVQMIPRLYDATQGSVEVGGLDVRQYDIETLRNEVSMVLQKNELFSGTIKDNLRWGNPEATDEELIHACQLAQADDFIRAFPDGYDTHIEQGGTNVSGGQKQRLCIARALLKKPKILILDDSTSAVDTHTDALIRKAFREEIPETTKFIIAQRISSVEDADLILVMDGGRIVGRGTHSQLMQESAIYREVYTSQMKGGTENEQAL